MAEEDYLLLSGLQHYVFCRRQWALIHVEQLWADNILTFKGQELHQKTNDPFNTEKRGELLISRALPLVSHSLRLYGIADVVEFRKVSGGGVRLKNYPGFWQPVPVEYKVGRPKFTDCDLVQLCAQAICLEEKLDIEIFKAYMFYGKTRRRLEVELDSRLRSKTRQSAEEMHELFALGVTPPAVRRGACEKCSLVDLCMPQLAKSGAVDAYFLRFLKA